MPSDAFMLGPGSELSLLLFVLGLGFASIGPGGLFSHAVFRAFVPSGTLPHGTKREIRSAVRLSLVIFLVLYPISLRPA